LIHRVNKKFFLFFSLSRLFLFFSFFFFSLFFFASFSSLAEQKAEERKSEKAKGFTREKEEMSGQAKPELAGVKVRKRKKDLKAKYEPEEFCEAVVEEIREAETIDQITKRLEASADSLDYKRYVEPLFDVLFTGAMLGSLLSYLPFLPFPSSLSPFPFLPLPFSSFPSF